MPNEERLIVYEPANRRESCVSELAERFGRRFVEREEEGGEEVDLRATGTELVEGRLWMRY